jgi:hypothetical protein
MSNVSGHRKITAQAVKDLTSDWKSHPLIRNLGAAGLPLDVVERDVIDVLIVGHWADFGQKHHFMRKFDGQSEYQAYTEAVEWIRFNALKSVQTLADRINRYYPNGVGSAGPSDQPGRQVFGGQVVMTPRGPMATDTPSWHALGNAVHALQDSFSEGHVVREKIPAGSRWPGAIKNIKRYAGEEKKGHKEADDAWRGSLPGGFSEAGRFAVKATKQILEEVIVTALSLRGRAAGTLADWDQFKDRWIKAASDLSKDRDLVFDLIDRFYHGVRVGATNVKTFSMDEDGLANALLNEAGTDTKLVLGVFQRLDEDYNSDADDVAELYVNAVRNQGGAVLSALKGNSHLITRLIKVMHEGWTSSGEKDCIRFLRQL